MRLLRALAYLALALTLVSAPVVHARAITAMPAPGHHGAHAVATMHAVMGHAAHDCDDRERGHPTEPGDACRMACCFLPAQVPARATAIHTAAVRAVRYADVTEFRPGQAPGPDHGVPRNA